MIKLSISNSKGPPLNFCYHSSDSTTDFILIYIYTGCAKKKKDILNIHIKSEGINIFSQKFAEQSLPYLWYNVKSSHL